MKTECAYRLAKPYIMRTLVQRPPVARPGSQRVDGGRQSAAESGQQSTVHSCAPPSWNPVPCISLELCLKVG